MTGAVTALQRIGGSIGTALLAVTLQHQTRMALSSGGGAPTGLLEPVGPTVRAHLADPLASAFGHPFTWGAVGMAAAAIIPAALLAREEWSSRGIRA